MAKQLVLATGNQGKVAELADHLAALRIEVLPQSHFNVPSVPETGTTFVENAIIKARHAAAITGLPAVADDSGLAVDALGGAPGVYSARYAGENASDKDNIVKLLDALKDVPEAQRSARFLCVLVFMRHADDPTPIICQGEWHGSIATAEMGEQGFGYDPVFYVPERKVCAAQLSRAEKHALSHRGKALAQLTRHLEQTRA